MPETHMPRDDLSLRTYHTYLLHDIGLAGSTATLYARMAKRILKTGLTPAQWLAVEVGPDTAKGTATSYSAAAKHFHAWLSGQSYAHAGGKPKRQTGRKRQKTGRMALRPEQLKRYAEVVAKHPSLADQEAIKTILLLLPWTGLRIAEACSVHSEWLERRGAHQGLKIVGKGSKERWVPLSPEAQRILRKYIAKAKPDRKGWMFHSITNRRLHINPNNVRVKLRALRPAMGVWALKLSPHDLRHHFASSLVKKGVDLATVQTLLGHERLETTAIYVHADESQLADAVAMLGKTE